MILSDPPAERAILSGLCTYGVNAYYDIADIIDESSFTIDSNIVIFKCLQHIFKHNDSIEAVDLASIYSAASTLSLGEFFKSKGENQHLQAVMALPVNLPNVRTFAAKIRKLQIAKILHSQLSVAQDTILQLSGEETIAHILGIAEDCIFNFSSTLHETDDAPVKLGDVVDNYIDELEANPVDHVGLPTGYPIYDSAIGGGLRPGTVNIIAARPKVGKTLLADNVGIFVGKNVKVPVLNVDTEMTMEDHLTRSLALMTEVNIDDIETGKFSQAPYLKHQIHVATKELKSIPYSYRSIGGMPFEEQLSVMRRWLVKEVGLKADGTANDCLIIYDYVKLMNANKISNDLKEYQLLGFIMTGLHNFALRYKIPILAFCQLNRDGITKESTDVASGSDRIIWLCSNFTIFKEKSDEEIAEDGIEAGNRKLVPLVSRHGSGLDHRDYINCHMKGWCAKITEGQTKFDLQTQPTNQGEITLDGNDQDIKF